MRLDYDPAKNAKNVRARGLSFDDVATLDWSIAVRRPDNRRDYGEPRIRAMTKGADGAPYAVVYTMRGETMWVISFRRAHAKEWRRYAEPEA